MNTAEYLAAVKARLNVTSDYAVAKALGVSRQAASDWRTGRAEPGVLTCYRIAQILDADPALIVADLERERAERAGKAAQASAWREWVEKLGGVAAALLMGTILSAPAPAQSRAAAGEAAGSVPAGSVYYVYSPTP